MHGEVGAADLVEDARHVRLRRLEARRDDRDPRLVLEVGSVERVELAEVGEVERTLDPVDLGLVGVETAA